MYVCVCVCVGWKKKKVYLIMMDNKILVARLAYSVIAWQDTMRLLFKEEG